MSEDKVNAAQKRSKSKSEIKPRKRDILSLVKADARLGLYRSLSMSPRNLKKDEACAINVKNAIFHAEYCQGVTSNAHPKSTDYIKVYSHYLPQTAPQGSPKRISTILYNYEILNPAVHLKNRFGLVLGLYVSYPPSGIPLTIIPLDNVLIERKDSTLISIKQPSGEATDEFWIQLSTPKLLEEWLFTLNRIALSNSKVRPTLIDPVPGKCADRLAAQHQCQFSADGLFKEISSDPPSWTLQAGRLEDFIIWSLYTCSDLEQDNLVLCGLLLYVVMNWNFDQFFTQFILIWSKTCLSSRYTAEWKLRLDCMSNQIARSVKFLNREEVFRFVDFCAYELGKTNKQLTLNLYKNHKISKKEEVSLSLFHSNLSLLPSWSENKDSTSRKSVLDIPTSELAHQLTYIEAAHHKQITPQEFVDPNHYPNGALKNTTKWWNKLSAWVTTEILSQQSVKQQVKVVRKFASLAAKLYDIRNYNSCTAILSGVNHNVIQRLKKLQEVIPTKYTGIISELQTKFSPNTNYAAYRNTVDFASPCLRFLAVAQRDLVFILDGNPQHVGEDLINLERMELISACLHKTGITVPSKAFAYQIAPDKTIQDFVLNAATLSEDELYALSFQQEPVRGSTSGEEKLSPREKEIPNQVVVVNPLIHLQKQASEKLLSVSSPLA